MPRDNSLWLSEPVALFLGGPKIIFKPQIPEPECFDSSGEGDILKPKFAHVDVLKRKIRNRLILKSLLL